MDNGHLEIAKEMMLSILYDNGYIDRWHSEKSQFSIKWQNKIAPIAGKFFDLHPELLTDENIEQICQGEVGETKTMFGKYDGFKELWKILGSYFEAGCGVNKKLKN
jgi:hypothetical protein